MAERTRASRPSLRKEWSRAFSLMLLFIAVAAATTLVGVHDVVNELQSSSQFLRAESSSVATLRAAIVSHEQVGHALLTGESVDRAAYLRDERHVQQLFASTRSVLASHPDLIPALDAAERSWRDGLTAYGLYGSAVTSLTGSNAAANLAYGVASARTVAAIDALSAPVLNEVQASIDHGNTLERNLLILLSTLFVIGLAILAWARRRFVTHVLRPVARLHDAALALRTGTNPQPLVANRPDELGELAESFNEMASAVHENQLSLAYQATHDMLTGLPNRTLLTERLSPDVPGGERRARQQALLYIDIDDFKQVNDSGGHVGGDAFLVEIAHRLETCVRPGDLVARIGGDEFAIVVDEDPGSETSVQIAQRALEALRRPVFVHGTALRATASIGNARNDPGVADTVALLRRADVAMYVAKSSGKDRFYAFADDAIDAATGGHEPAAPAS